MYVSKVSLHDYHDVLEAQHISVVPMFISKNRFVLGQCQLWGDEKYCCMNSITFRCVLLPVWQTYYLLSGLLDMPADCSRG